MKVYYFSSPTGLGALTDDKLGSKLPAELGPWRFITNIFLTEEHADQREAQSLISAHGFCCFTENAE